MPNPRTRRPRAASLAILAASLLLAPGAAQAQALPEYTVRASAAPCLRVRAAAGTEAPPLACLPPGTRVAGVAVSPFWREVRLPDGRSGWAARRFLESPDAPPAGPADSLPADPWLEIHFVDVGQGDGIWIRTPDDGIDGNGIFEGRNVVIDGGPDSGDDTNEMVKYLEARGEHDAVLDALILTHPHDDHYRGAEGVLRHFQVLRYYDPGVPKGGVAYPAFLDAVRKETAEGAPTRVMLGRAQFDSLDWGRELQARVLYSYPGTAEGLGSKPNTVENNGSIVLRIAYGEHSFLLMGDAEGKERKDPPDQPRYVEKLLLESVPPEELRSTVLKLGHHGSETSSTFPFMAAVSPEVIVISSGRKSFMGTYLPDASVLRRYCAQNPRIRIYRTDRDDEQEGRTVKDDADGDHVVVRTNGKVLEVRSFSAGKPVDAFPC